jgi:hypothetical protein
VKPGDVLLGIAGLLGAGFIGFTIGQATCKPHVAITVSKTRMPPAERIYPFASPLGCDARMVVMAAGVVYHQACYVRTNPQVWL